MPYKWNDKRYNLRTIIETIENTQSRFVDSMEDLTHLSRQSMRPQSASTQTFSCVRCKLLGQHNTPKDGVAT